MHEKVWQEARLLWEGMLDLIYPPVCLVCQSWDCPPLCEACYRSFTPIPEPVCVVCGRPVWESTPCGTCEEADRNGGWGFEMARAAGIYIGSLREAIHRLKYGRESVLGPLLGAYLADRCTVEELLPPEVQAGLDAVVPVPLHKKREKKRGYNQAHLLAEPLADALRLPLRPELLQRTAFTPPQVSLGGKARRESLQASPFTVPETQTVRGLSLLLVDDVFTTGATVSACASAFKAAGASRVIVLTLAAGG